MVFMAVIWLIQPAKNAINYYFAAMYSSTGLIVLYAWAERTGLIYKAYLFYDLQIPLCYVFAPLLYYGFSQITDLHRKPAAFFLPDFIPAIASQPIIVVNNLAKASVFAGLPEHPLARDLQAHPSFLFVHILGLGSNVYILYFLIRILITGAALLRDKEIENFRELRLLLFFISWFIVDILLMMVAHLAGMPELLYVAKFLSSSTFIAYSFYSFRYPEYTQQVVRKSRQIRYKNIQMRGLDVEELLKRLDYLMTEERIFQDPELTQVSLSAQLMVPPHTFTEILNKHLHVNFRSYLNERRVKAAERLLLERPEDSILDIAFEAGFNSKASFNDNFMKQTGQSPTEYRKRGLMGAKDGAGAVSARADQRRGP